MIIRDESSEFLYNLAIYPEADSPLASVRVVKLPSPTSPLTVHPDVSFGGKVEPHIIRLWADAFLLAAEIAEGDTVSIRCPVEYRSVVVAFLKKVQEQNK